MLFFEPRPYSLSDISLLDWEPVPSARLRDQNGSAIEPAQPDPVDLGPLRARAVTKIEDSVRVSAAVPSAEESRSLFGVQLEQRGVQPLWLEIENGSDRVFHVLRTGLDPEYFAPLEVAFLYQGSFNDRGGEALGEHLQALSFDSRSRIDPGETVSGFVYANTSHPSMMLDVDLVGPNWSDRIGLVVPVLGKEVAQERVTALADLYAESDVTEIENEATLRTALEALPCCAVDETGTAKLPLNWVVIGELDEWGPALGRRNYRYTSASPWYAFGREQDLSGHKISRWVAPQPHTLRAWLTPLRYRGKPVWVGQVSMRRGGRFAASEEGTGGIDPAVDEARNDVVQDLLYSQGVAKIGWVGGSDPVDASAPQVLEGSTDHTDGLRAVLEFSDETVSLGGIDFFDWERLVDHSNGPVSNDRVP